MAKARDLYDVLGVKSTVDGAALKAAYRKLAMELHPDRTKGDPEKETRFKEVSVAYAILSDSKRRREYDASRPGIGGVHGAKNSIFGPMFDDLLGRVNEEGIGSHNIDSLLQDLLQTAADVQKRVPERAKAVKTPSALLDLVEDIFDTTIAIRSKK